MIPYIVIVLSILLVHGSASAQPDFAAVKKSLVVVKDGPGNESKQAPGFGISDLGHIVTYAGPLGSKPSYLVSNAEGQIFSADRLAADEKTGLLILKLSGSGHGVTALNFAKTALQAAAPLYAVTFNPSGPERFTPVAGTVTQLLTADGSQIITHNALFSPESAGTPLLNRCYEAVGVNVLQKQGVFQTELDPTEQGIAQSIASASLSRILAALGLPLPVVETECLSLEEETRQKLEQAQQEKEAALQQEKEAAEEQAREAAEQARRKEEALQREKAAVEEQAREAATQAAAERQRIEEETRRQLEQSQQEQEAAEEQAQAAQQQARQTQQRQHQILLYASIAGGLLLLGIVVALWSKRRRLRAAEQEQQRLSGNVDRMQSELSEASERDRLRSSAPDVFIEGTAPPIALKIPGASLVEPGAIVGRSPSESTFVINHEQISRRHFRLVLVSQQIMIEDLGSTNGTSVDGVPLEPGNQTPAREGSRLALGDLELTLHIGG